MYRKAASFPVLPLFYLIISPQSATGDVGLETGGGAWIPEIWLCGWEGPLIPHLRVKRESSCRCPTLSPAGTTAQVPDCPTCAPE